MISLIANTGIQFYNAEISIDLNEGRNKMFFHEWFDTNDSKAKLEIAHFFAEEEVWVRKRELATYGFLQNGKPTADWATIQADGIKEIDLETGTCFNMFLSKCKIENFENKWLPFPYFELNKQNDTVFGPINWCRVKLVPNDKSSGNKRCYDVILAFDTRTGYMDGNFKDEDRETPVFADRFQDDKSFALCNNEFKLIDFCSSQFNCEWVNNYILKLVHNTTSSTSLSSPRFTYLASYIYFMQYLQLNCDFPVIKLFKDQHVERFNVDLVIDIGNSRTSAVLFEEGAFDKVRPLELQDISNPLARYADPFDMRLAFHKAYFGDFGIVNSKQFVYPSFIRLGKEANNLIYRTINENYGSEKLTTCSSPKRYLWDDKPHKVEWEFVQTEGMDKRPIWIDGISQQFNKNGSLNKDGSGGVSNSYSLSSLMTLAFLEILCQARMQINSFKYRDEIGNANRPRKINRIIITCPTAMSKIEQTALRKSAEEAAIVLERYISNSYNDNMEYQVVADKIKVIPSVKNLSSTERLEWTYDEATCSQFVFLYAEISKRYLNNCEEYFDMFGKVRNDLEGYNQKSLTIGSLDIGAGTTDLMICAYEYDMTAKCKIKPIPLFWESFYHAGDDLLKEFVRQLIIEGPYGGIRNKLIELEKGGEAAALLFAFFGRNHSAMTFQDRQYRHDFNLQVSIPIAMKFLALAQEDTDSKTLTYNDIFENQNQPGEKLLTHFEKHFGFSIRDLKWQYKAEISNAIITKTFEPLLQKIAAVMYAYKCDFILLAGRPTSLKQVENLFLKFYAVPPNRLVTLNKYRVGLWYPYHDGNGYFSKGEKSIVAVGALIGYLASTNGDLTGFSLDLSVLKDKLMPTTEYFGLMNNQTQKVDSILIQPQLNHATFPITSLPVSLGCRQLNTDSYPARVFYFLDFNTDNMELNYRSKGVNDLNQLKAMVEAEKIRIRSKMPLSVSITREDYKVDKESLLLESVTDKEGEELPLRFFTLQIQSMNEPENFWLDTGEFILDIQTRN